MRTYLVEITAVINLTGTTTVLRFADKGFTTRPTDTPPNAVYIERLKQPALVRRDMYANGTTGGASRVGFGELVLSNVDGGLDFAKDYGFDGQPLRVLVGDPDMGFASFSTVLTATMEQVELDQKEMRIRVRDRQAELDEPIQSVLYAGTGGVEGTGLDVQGRPKPLIYGQVYNCVPVQVNPALRIYQFANNTGVTMQLVYERGITLTRQTPDYATQADLLNATLTPPAGQYRVFQGFFRLGSSPTGVLTFDAVEGAALADRSAAQVLRRMALQAGIPSADITAADVTALSTANPSEVGIYIDNEASAIQAMDEVAQSIGAYFGFDQLGKFRMGRLESPGATAIVTIDENLIIGNELERTTSRDDGRGIPTYRVKVQYARNYTPQDRTSLAAAVADTRAAELALEYRSVFSEDLQILNKHKLAPELVRTTLLTKKVDADAEALRLLNLYKVRREVYDVTVRLESQVISQLDIGRLVQIQYRRFGLDTGKNFIVIGLEVDYQRNRANLVLWG